MLKTTNHPTRRRWLESAGLLTIATALSAKTLSRRGESAASLSTSQKAEPRSLPRLAEDPSFETPAPRPPAGQAQPLTYEEFLAGFDLRYIQPREVIRPHLQTTRGVRNTLPPQELWAALPATLFLADEIRERLGKPLKLITSAYRDPRYNRACGGASRSWHTQNCALDLVYEGGPREAFAIARDLREEGYFEGGIGLYRTFLHLDTRGQNATWGA